MMTNDSNRPLGQGQLKHLRNLPISIHQMIAAVFAIVLGAFALWAIMGDNLLGGKPVAAVAIDAPPAMAPKKPEAVQVLETAASAQDRHGGAGHTETGKLAVPLQAAPRTTKTVTIIDGKTGALQEVIIPATDD